MKTRLMAIAAGLLTMGAAQAQMSIYGLLDVSVGKSIADDNAKRKVDFHSGGDDGSGQGNSASRVGMKGTTKVSNDVSINFKLETNGITSDGDVPSPFFQRQAWLGMSGGFGEVRLGRQDSVPFQTMIAYDFNGASNGVSALGYANAAIWGRGRQSRSLQYLSPNFSGLKFQLGYSPKGNVVNAKDTLSAAVTYAAGPFSASVATESKRSVGGTNFSSVGGSYDFGFAKVMLGYVDGGKNATGANLGFVVPVGVVSFGMMASKNSDTKGTALEVFANTEIFKNTYLYAEAGRTDSKTGIKGTGAALGVIYTF